MRTDLQPGATAGIFCIKWQIFPNGPSPKPERMTETSDWK